MIIPWQEIEPETLLSVLETFVLREGTDYGEQECSLQQKVEDVQRQLIRGEVVLVWSEHHETLNLLPAAQFNRNSEESVTWEAQ